MVSQIELTLTPRRRGVHLITSELMKVFPALPNKGIVNILIKHTSAALALNENADPDVRADLATIFDKMVPENAPYYLHTLEGSDDMPAHAKSVIVGATLTLPITNGRLNLGTWQGVYLCEFRDYGGPRKIVVTIIGE